MAAHVDRHDFVGIAMGEKDRCRRPARQVGGGKRRQAAGKGEDGGKVVVEGERIVEGDHGALAEAHQHRFGRPEPGFGPELVEEPRH